VGRDEVLQNGETFPEVRRDGGLDDLARGFAISPLMPASCRIWAALPRAPESAIMYMGLKLSVLTLSLFGPTISSVLMSFSISLATFSVACAQMSMTLL